MYPVHEKKQFSESFERFDRLWNRHPQYRELLTITTLDELLSAHPSYQEVFDELHEENNVRLIEWSYRMEPIGRNLQAILADKKLKKRGHHSLSVRKVS